MLTRSQVATVLGKSIATVRRMEGHELHPERNSAGVHLFDPKEVHAVRRGRGVRTALLPRSEYRHSWPTARHCEERDDGVHHGLEQDQRIDADQLAQLLRAARAEGAQEERERLHAQCQREQDLAQRNREAEEQALCEAKIEAIEFLATLSPREFRRLSRDPEFTWLLAELEQLEP